MPSWVTHIVTANKVLEKVDFDRDKFIFANVMPDILNGHIIKDISKNIPYEETHFTKAVNFNGINTVIPDIYKFKEIYKNSLDNPIISGYFAHLLADYYWNFYAYSTYFESLDKNKNHIKVKLNNGKVETVDWNSAVAIKQKDFRIFSYYLTSMLKEDIDLNSSQLWEDIKKMKEFKYNKKDIDNTVMYLRNLKNVNIGVIQESYEIFNQKELIQKLDESVNFIIENLK